MGHKAPTRCRRILATALAPWARDSSVQVAVYIPFIAKDAGLRFIVEGTIRKLSLGIIADP